MKSAGTVAAQATAGGLADVLKHHTHELHREAERTGVVADMIRGDVTRVDYALYLRNVLPAYRVLEQSMDARADLAALRPFSLQAVYRAQAIESDLRVMIGPYWDRTLPLLGAGERYANRIADVAANDCLRLIAHAYVRYLGDLSGGQILRRLLARSLGLGPDALSFYDFPDIADINAFKETYRDAIDQVGRDLDDVRGVVDETATAFRLNIDVSKAVQAAAGAPHAAVREPLGATSPGD